MELLKNCRIYWKLLETLGKIEDVRAIVLNELQKGDRIGIVAEDGRRRPAAIRWGVFVLEVEEVNKDQHSVSFNYYPSGFDGFYLFDGEGKPLSHRGQRNESGGRQHPGHSTEVSASKREPHRSILVERGRNGTFSRGFPIWRLSLDAMACDPSIEGFVPASDNIHATRRLRPPCHV